jgi:peptidoglycan/LPS O-acetylase OafA/YrhL
LSAPATAVGRFAFLDAVRAVAAIAVVCEHVGEIFPSAHRWLVTDFNPGRAGVFAFFIVSGFVIPFSLERSNDLRKFWINRIFRLYPLYWSSLIAACLIYAVLPAKVSASFPFWQQLPVSALANLTMLQDLFKEPHAVGAYWTLTFELFFYVLLSLLFAVRLNRHTGCLLSVFTAFFAAIAVRLYHPGGTTLFYAVFATGTFFFGTWIFRYWSGAVSKKTFWLVGGAFLVSASLAAIQAFFLHQVQIGPTQMPPLAAATGWLVGYAFFGLLFALRDAKFPHWLLVLGQISYSIYLLQGVLLLLTPVVGAVAGAVLTVIGAPLLALLTYHRIEAPAMKLGRHITGKIEPRPV